MHPRSADILSFQNWAWTQRLNRIFLYTSLFLFHCPGSWLEKGCRGAVSLKLICIYYAVFVLWQWQLNSCLFIGDLPLLWAMPCRREVPSLPGSALCLVWDSSGPFPVCTLSAHGWETQLCDIPQSRSCNPIGKIGCFYHLQSEERKNKFLLCSMSGIEVGEGIAQVPGLSVPPIPNTGHKA